MGAINRRTQGGARRARHTSLAHHTRHARRTRQAHNALRISCVLIAVACLTLAMLLAGGCAPKTAPSGEGDGSSSKTAAGEPIAIDWSPETDCTLCHTTEAASIGDASCDMVDHIDITCVQCHADTDTLKKMHDGKTTADMVPKRLKKTGIDDAYCISCHPQVDVAEKTANSAVLTDVNGLVVNPHAIPETPTHVDITCNDCHSMHTDKSERSDDAQRFCRTCHHQDVYECFTCHQHG